MTAQGRAPAGREPTGRATRRAERLVRLYPRTWRQRYGDEFTELLIADLCERPRSLSRTLDVIRGALLARLTAAGLSGDGLEPPDRLRASLAALGCAMAVFLVFGVGLWSQLMIGWQWSSPNAASVTLAMLLMSAALSVLVALASMAVAPIVWSALTACRPSDRRALLTPGLLFLVGAAVLVAGSVQFAHGWPGTGGRPWAQKGLVPGGLAAFGWASTFSITCIWPTHPTRRR